ncbi:MAG: PadR family transcriptional regulator [Vicinamibacterales bacterium]
MPPPSTPLTDLEELTLLVVAALGGDAYGVTVQRALEEHGGRRIGLGAAYALLDRLEQRGCLRSDVGDATPVRGGRRKRLFTATPLGLRALRQTRQTRERLWRMLHAPEGSE